MNQLLKSTPTAPGKNEYEQQKGTNGSAHVTLDSLPADYRYMVTPEISGTPTPSIVIDGESGSGTDYVPRYVLITVNPGDDVTAATRLMNGYPDVLMLQPEQSIEIASDTAITDVYVIGIAVGAGGAALDIDTFTDYNCLIGRGDTDVADWLAQMTHWTFDSADAVKLFRAQLTGAVDTNVKILRGEGLSYA